MKKMTLRSLANSSLAVPPATAWYLSDLGEFRGKQELYTRQSPQRLKALCEHALIESAVSSNRIEGVSIEPSRVRDVLVSPKPLFRDRDEEEVRGYRDALTWIHQEAERIPISNETIRHLHATTRGQIWDAGLYILISELEQTCPGVSRDMVRRVLREQQAAGAVECQGRGPGATWLGKG